MGISESVISTYCRLKRWFFHETWALPVDIFRFLPAFFAFSISSLYSLKQMISATLMALLITISF
jgi:hypothetical protein